VHSDASTVDEYLAALPDDRRAQLEPVYRAVHDAMPDGFAEMMAWGMISWSIPLADFPDTYNGEPLCYAGLAAQKQKNSLYLMGLYADSAEAEDFRARWTADGTRLDMGKSCVRFRTLDAERLRLVAGAIAATTPDDFIAMHERARAERR